MDHHYTQPSRLTLLAYRLLYDPLRRRELRALVASLELTGSERVLDFGSGAGSEADLLATALGRGGRLTCLDVSPSWLAEARRRLRRHANVEFLLGEANEVDLAPETFDVIVANFVLHDVDRAALPGTLGALSRSLRREGRFVVVEPIGSRHALPAGELKALMTLMGLADRSVYRPSDAVP